MNKMIKKDIFNRDLKARFKAAARDRIHRFVMADKKNQGRRGACHAHGQ